MGKPCPLHPDYNHEKPAESLPSVSSSPENVVDIARVLEATSVSHVHYLPETDSTNVVAIERAAHIPDQESELVLTGSQLKGKGRGDNKWFSSAGSLTFSLITRTLPIEPWQTPQVSLAAGLAICQAVESLAPAAQTQLKWPNDVYINARKAAGILIEVPRQSVARFVVGVGLNVNNSLDGVPEEVRETAISLSQVASQRVPMTDVLIECLNRFDQALKMLIAGDAMLPELWRSYSFLTNRRVRIVLPGSAVEGVCRAIADDGALVLETDEGDVPCYGGVVEWIR